MTEFSGAEDKEGFDGKTLLLECGNNEYVYISGLEIFKFKTDDKVIDYISLMGNNMIPYAFIIGEKYTYFIVIHYKFIQNDKVEEDTLLNATSARLYPFDYHLEKCGVDSFKNLERSLIHSCWPDDGGYEEDEENGDDVLVEEDVEDGDLIETRYLNGNNEVFNIFNPKCVICFEKDSVYAFRQCGHHCICEDGFNKRWYRYIKMRCL